MYFYDNGDRYEGEWLNDKRNGRGKLWYTQGDVYDGEWIDDQRSGLGVLFLGL